MLLINLIISFVFLTNACNSTQDTPIPEDKPEPIRISFENIETGLYPDSKVKSSWPGVQWSNVYNRFYVVEKPSEENAKCIRISYPKGSVGPSEGGGQFLIDLPARNEYYLSYQLRFGDNFDFRRGGKLPGLTSGGGKYTGGNLPEAGDGWSARYMWKENGKLIVYLYYVDMPGKYGENLSLNFAAERNKWYTLTQRIKVNDPGKNNGILEVWIDDEKVLSRKDIRFRIGEAGKIDSFYFSTFHGGNDETWAPVNDSFLYFDELYIGSAYPK